MVGLQYGLDGKIYGNNKAFAPNGYMAVINYPNASGFACGYQDSAIFLEGRFGYETVPNFPSNFFTTNILTEKVCVGDTAFFQVNYHFIDSVLWNFGDPTSGAQNTSTDENAFHIYGDTGLYTVILVAQNGAVIDTVSKNIHIEQAPEVNLGPDIELCQSSVDSVMLASGMIQGEYLWSTGSTDTTEWIQVQDLPLNVPQDFYLTVSNYCGADTDTVRIITSAPLSISLGNDTSICDDSLMVIPNVSNENGLTQYRWSNGDSTKSTLVLSNSELKNTITIQLTSTNACGSDSDSISITFLPPADGFLPEDSIYCKDRPFYLLNPFSEGVNYLWIDSNTGPDLRIDSSGIYWLLSFNQCDTLFSDVEITFNGEPKIELGNDTFVCPGAEILLRNLEFSASADQSIRWNTGSEEALISVSDSGLYIATITLRDCKTSDSILIFPKQFCPERCKPSIANVITPNADGVNDALKISLLCNTPDLRLRVFNRWGQLLYQGNGRQASWDGYSNEGIVSEGTYFYVLEFTNEEGENAIYRGSVAVIR